MKLPRWLVVCLLSSSLLAVLGAAGWWWVTWPKRTARNFVRLLAAHRFDEATAMVGGFDDEWEVDVWIVWDRPEAWDVSKIRPQARTICQMFDGHQAFVLLPENARFFRFTVERGMIVHAPFVRVETRPLKSLPTDPENSLYGGPEITDVDDF